MFYLSGRKGSGKSYYAVDYIVNNLDNYSKIYANINGLKAKELGVRPLAFPYLIEILTECKYRFDTSSNELGDDVEVIELDSIFLEYLISSDSKNFLCRNDKYDDYITAKNNRASKSKIKKLLLDMFKPLKEQKEYKPVLVVVDECYTYFDKKKVDDLLLWFISYSRHMFIDLILISQDPGDISTSYLKRVELFYDAVPISSQFNTSKFKYKKYNKYPFFKTTYVGDIHIDKKKEIFNYYSSGDRVRVKSIFTRYFLGLGALVVGLYYMINILFSDMNNQSSDSNSTKDKKAVVKDYTKKDYLELKDESMIKDIKVIDDVKYSYLIFECHSDFCYSKDIKLSKNDLDILIKNTNSTKLSTTSTNNFSTYITVFASSKFVELFEVKKEDEDNIFKSI